MQKYIKIPYGLANFEILAKGYIQSDFFSAEKRGFEILADYVCGA